MPPFLDCQSAITDRRVGKSKLINKAIQDIGMGRYQWELFVLCGFGWLADKFVTSAVLSCRIDD